MDKLFSKNRTTQNYLILHITSTCDMSCMHCFNWKNLKNTPQKEVLSLNLIKSLFECLNLKSLTLTGGEPFLRDDLTELCRIYNDSGNHLKSLYIPTNGYNTENIIEKVHILSGLSKTRTTIGVSIDGLKDTHNRIRRKGDAFEKATQTIASLIALKKEYPQLTVLVNTCVHKDNIREFPDLSEYLIKRLPGLDQHEVDIVRAEPQSKDISLPDRKEFKDFMNDVDKIKKYYFKKNNISKSWLRYIAVLSIEETFLRYQYEIIFNDRYLSKCSIPEQYLTVFSNADVSFCELTKPIGNLKDRSINDILDSFEAQQRKKEIIQNKCRCYHGCYVPFFITTRPFKIRRGFSMFKRGILDISKLFFAGRN